VKYIYDAIDLLQQIGIDLYRSYVVLNYEPKRE